MLLQTNRHILHIFTKDHLLISCNLNLIEDPVFEFAEFVNPDMETVKGF